MSELKNTESAASKFDYKLHKLIKRAKKQRGMLWPSVVFKLELARADVQGDAAERVNQRATSGDVGLFQIRYADERSATQA